MVSNNELIKWFDKHDIDPNDEIVKEYSSFNKYEYPENLFYDAYPHNSNDAIFENGKYEYSEIFGKYIKQWVKTKLTDEIAHLVMMRYDNRMQYHDISTTTGVCTHKIEYWLCAVVYELRVKFPEFKIFVARDIAANVEMMEEREEIRKREREEAKLKYEKWRKEQEEKRKQEEERRKYERKLESEIDSIRDYLIFNTYKYPENIFHEIFGIDIPYYSRYYTTLIRLIGFLSPIEHDAVIRRYKRKEYHISDDRYIRQAFSYLREPHCMNKIIKNNNLYIIRAINKYIVDTIGIKTIKDVPVSKLNGYYECFERFKDDDNIHTVRDICKMRSSEIHRLKYLEDDDIIMLCEFLDLFNLKLKPEKGSAKLEPYDFSGWGNPYITECDIYVKDAMYYVREGSDYCEGDYYPYQDYDPYN